MKRTFAILLGLMLAGPIMAKGFDGANAPGGQQVGGAPMADQDGDLGWQEGNPGNAGNPGDAGDPGNGGSAGIPGNAGLGGDPTVDPGANPGGPGAIDPVVESAAQQRMGGGPGSGDGHNGIQGGAIGGGGKGGPGLGGAGGGWNERYGSGHFGDGGMGWREGGGAGNGNPVGNGGTGNPSSGGGRGGAGLGGGAGGGNGGAGGGNGGR